MKSLHSQPPFARCASSKTSLPDSPVRFGYSFILILLGLTPFASRAQVNPGYAITSLPYVITNSGHYYLPHNFNNFSLTPQMIARGIYSAIRIAVNDSTNDVELDLNDHTITAVSTWVSRWHIHVPK